MIQNMNLARCSASDKTASFPFPETLQHNFIRSSLPPVAHVAPTLTWRVCCPSPCPMAILLVLVKLWMLWSNITSQKNTPMSSKLHLCHLLVMSTSIHLSYLCTKLPFSCWNHAKVINYPETTTHQTWSPDCSCLNMISTQWHKTSDDL